MQRLVLEVSCFSFLLWATVLPARAETFRIATYNLDGYLDQRTARGEAKSVASRLKIRETIRAAAPDVLALQEVGSPQALAELSQGLKTDGLNYPYSEYISGSDTNIHLAMLSRFPITLRQPHTNDTFLLGTRRWHVSRGFGEVQLKVNEQYRFTLITAHLKSRRSMAQADESEVRLAEAKLLRQKVEACLSTEPGANLVVLGDLNDTKDSLVVRTLVGRGTMKLTDTRPAERDSSEQRSARPVTWTHFYAATDTYSRIDYILLSPGMAKEWIPDETRIPRVPDWGLASDHRLLVAAFTAQDK